MTEGELLYAAFMALALLVAAVARRRLPPDPLLFALPRRQRLAIALAAFVGGVVGARLPFAGSGFDDGKTILGGFGGGYLAVELTKLALGVRAKTGDSFALPVALACAVGRWGCFFHGCCAGKATTLPWAFDFGDGVPRHPTQLYEFLFHLAMAWALYATAARGSLRFQRMKLYLIAYCGFRFAVEFLRTEPRILLGLSGYQWAAAAFAALLAVQWRHDRRRLALPAARELAAGARS
jgi:prolipoprotein diacylglyceryltransferase